MFKNVLLNLLVISLFMVGCQKDVEEFNPNDQATYYTSGVFGVVLDENQNPIEGALVSYNGKSINTDEYGTYNFENVQIGDKHNFISIRKDGYFESGETFRTDHAKKMQFSTVLLKKEFNYSFESSDGATVNTGNITFEFPSNGIMYYDSEADYTGEVKLAVKYLDPLERTTFESMPGDLSSLNDESELGTLSSYGMVYVELQSADGSKLQVKSGKKVTMTSEIRTELLSSAPQQIAMWYFDEATGLWVEEGVAQKTGTAYVATVSHFSCWNYDYNYPAIVLSGRVVNQSGNTLSGVHVWVSPVGEYSGGHGNTDSDGTFSGLVPKGLALELRIYSYAGDCYWNWQDPDYVLNIGPFSEDTDIGDIVFEETDLQYLDVNADFVNCDGNPVTNGFVTIGNKYFQLEDGTLNVSIPYCQSTTAYMTAVDRDYLKSMDPVELQVPGSYDLGQLSICDSEAENIKISCSELGINVTMIDSLVTYTYGQNPISHNIGGADFNSQESPYINLNFEDSSSDFTVGEYNIGEETFFSYYDVNNQSYKYYNSDSGTVTITKGGTHGDVIEGTFSLKLYEQNDPGTLYDFNGSFKVTYY